MGLLDIFKRRDSVPEKATTCEKTDSGANMVKEIREEILKKTAIPYMKLQLTDTKPGLFDSKAVLDMFPTMRKFRRTVRAHNCGCWHRSTVQRSRWKISPIRGCCNSGF